MDHRLAQVETRQLLPGRIAVQARREPGPGPGPEGGTFGLSAAATSYGGWGGSWDPLGGTAPRGDFAFAFGSALIKDYGRTWSKLWAGVVPCPWVDATVIDSRYQPG